jgi:hypothetical protein
MSTTKEIDHMEKEEDLLDCKGAAEYLGVNINWLSNRANRHISKSGLSFDTENWTLKP